MEKMKKWLSEDGSPKSVIDKAVFTPLDRSSSTIKGDELSAFIIRDGDVPGSSKKKKKAETEQVGGPRKFGGGVYGR